MKGKTVGMKRWVMVFVVIMIGLCIGVPVSADEKGGEDFSTSIFENEPYYQYDAFEKTWKYFSGYFQEYSNGANFTLGISLYGNEEEIYHIPELYLRYSSKEPDCTVNFKGIAFMIDGVIYRWNEMFKVDIENGETMVAITENNKEFLKALGEADPQQIAVKVYTDTHNVILDKSSWDESLADLQAVALKCYEEDVWKYTGIVWDNYLRNADPVITAEPIVYYS